MSIEPINILSALIFLVFAITFIESGIDKVINKTGNLEWLSGHFSKSILSKIVSPLFYIITFQELIAGILMVVSIINCFYPIFDAGFPSLFFILFLLIQLFAGQRIAKDYVGASGIIPYMILCILGLVICQFNQ